jgi:isopentenyl diphosphate isomerase/L-lactate dehydrogenase-like FMN-dependent dehydrogenase
MRASLASTLRVSSAPAGSVRGPEVLFDSGIRSGSDIIKALCLGARAVLIGRAYAYGLGAAGGPGVARAIDILRTDIVRTLKLLGCTSIAELDHSYVKHPEEWTAPNIHSHGIKEVMVTHS